MEVLTSPANVKFVLYVPYHIASSHLNSNLLAKGADEHYRMLAFKLWL